MNFFSKILLLSISCLVFSSEEESQPPHIIFIFIDDLGWNDVSFHGAPDMPTPNIDALALSGIILNNYYGEWLCTPSRAALLSGKYPIRLGLQRLVINAGEASALPIEVPTLPQFLKLRGYDTHMVGKWHLGYQRKIYMPTYRGFDTFFGYLNGQIDYYDYTYYDYTNLPNQKVFFGKDLYNGTKVITDFSGKYAPYVFGEHATNIINNHDVSKPLFLYLSHIAVHVSNSNQRLQAPPEIIRKFKYIKDVNRRIHAAKLAILDYTIGTVFEALHRKDMLKNSVVMLVSDNGGLTVKEYGGYSSNYPFRGGKFTYWEGGVRVPSVIWSPRLKLEKPRVSKQLMHVTDWLPTVYHIAGGNIADLGKIDGHNLWPAFIHNLPSPRTSVLNTMDPVDGLSALRLGDFKLVNGTTSLTFDLGDSGQWYGPSGSENVGKPASLYNWIFKDGSIIRDILMREGWWIADRPDEVYASATVTCPQPPPRIKDCQPTEAPCLFNVIEDPCEYRNLAKERPDLVAILMKRVNIYEKEQIPPQAKVSDSRADPMCHNFTYVPWLDAEYYTECDYAS